MPLKMIRQDITKIVCDAIVNPTNRHLEPGGGADLAIHQAAGSKLYEYCKMLGGCPVGSAKITPAFSLPCKFVIHTAGPDWYREEHPEELLISCYRESLMLAVKSGCESVAIPLISSGAYGYPKDKVLKVATNVISEFLLEHELMVYLVIYDKTAYEISSKIFSDITSFIDDNYIEEHPDVPVRSREVCYGAATAFPAAPMCSRTRFEKPKQVPKPMVDADFDSIGDESDELEDCGLYSARGMDDLGEIEKFLNMLDESFSQMLLRKIDEKGMKDSECYKKANIDRKLFSKIRSDIHYKPSKPTVIAFALALELSFEETCDMLKKAGFALSHSSKFDLIVEYFIKHGNYNVFEINEVLFTFDQNLIGV